MSLLNNRLEISKARRKWAIRAIILLFILASWVALFVISFKPKGVANVLRMVTKPLIRFFYTPQVLVLCNFETHSDLNDWYRNAILLELSWDYATAGEASGKVQFENLKMSGESFPGLMLENYVIGPKGEKDWSRYSFFKADFYNPTSDDIPLLIKIKDSRTRVIQEAFTIEGGEEGHFSLDLVEVAELIDLKNIVHLNLFLYIPEKEATLFVDNVRLEQGRGDIQRRLDRPFLSFVGLDAPSQAKLGETIAIACSFKTSRPINREYAVFIHLFPLSEKEKKFSRRLGYLKADIWPFTPTTQWEVGETYQVGPLGIYIPLNNPVGEYGIQVGLYNPASRGSSKPRFEMPSRGAIDFSGTHPKLRYTNKAIGKDYIVGKIAITK